MKSSKSISRNFFFHQIFELEKKLNVELKIDDIVDFSSYEKGKKILKKYKIQIK